MAGRRVDRIMRIIVDRARVHASDVLAKRQAASVVVSARNVSRCVGEGGKFKRGGIMLEVIISLLFVSIGLAAVAGLMSQSVSRLHRTRLQTRAMLLAESKLAELQVGLHDLIEGSEGDFDGRPEKFTWAIDVEPTEIAELVRVMVTIGYDDPSDGFEVHLYRIYSPSLNFSTERLKEIASDPSALESLDSPGLYELLSMIGDLPGGEALREILLGGGASEMMRMFGKLIEGRISPELLLELTTEADEISSASAMSELVRSDTSGGSLPTWNDFETAGTGDDPLLALAGPIEVPDVSGDDTEEPSTETETETEAETTETSTQPRSRAEAIREMMGILRKLARERRR